MADFDCNAPCGPNEAAALPTVNAPCVACGEDGGGLGQPDIEQSILCDVGPDGQLLGTALAVYEYDADGNPSGPPTLVDPVTGDPYVAQGILQPCPTGDCGGPMQFCFNSTSTGPVEHPGRRYEMELPINPGFAVESMNVDAVTHAANIVWNVDDPDGEAFRQELTTFIDARVPAAATVTITNPNAGTAQVCGEALPMTIVIECLRLDSNPPNLIELIYNGGRDMILNPAYNEDPALNPPVSQGNYGFRLLSRSDDPGPFPGNQPANDALCTNVANRGWETNDQGRTFEIWGQNIRQGEGVVPTPRGTPVQEITSDGPPPGQRSTIWQTFVAPASGDFNINLVHGARDNGEEHRITLTPGDTDHVQGPGAIIDDVTTPPQVTTNGGNPASPWTVFNDTIPLVGGQTYTLAFSSTNPVGGARGGLFTDMRAFINLPGLRSTAATDDETCVVTTEETTTTTLCEYWQPQCSNGVVVGWRNVQDGEALTNAQFWGQVPAPGCCLPQAAGGDGGSVSAGNLIYNYEVCGVVGGVQQTLNRVIITDQSGGAIAQMFIGQDGGPVTPDAGWRPGACPVAIPEEVDQYDTAPVPACFSDGVTTSWFTYERVRFNNRTSVEISRVRHWYDPVTGVDQITQPAGLPIACDAAGLEVQVVESEEMGCANGVPWSRRRTAFFGLDGQLLVTTYNFVDSDENEQNVAPAGFTLGDCHSRYDYEIAVEPGCADGESWDRIARVAYDTTLPPGSAPVSITYLYIDNNEATQPTAPDGWALGSCIGQRRLYSAHIETAEGTIRSLQGYAADPLFPAEQMELVAWSVRHRSGTVTVEADDALIGPGPVTLDPGEVLNFDAGDDPRGTLNSTVVIDTTSGSARLTYQYRRSQSVV